MRPRAVPADCGRTDDPACHVAAQTTPEETETATDELYAVYRLVKRAGKTCGAQVRDEIVPFGCDFVVENL